MFNILTEMIRLHILEQIIDYIFTYRVTGKARHNFTTNTVKIDNKEKRNIGL